MTERKYQRVYDWAELAKLPRTDYDDIPPLTELQDEWCVWLRDSHREHPERLVQAAGILDRFPGAMTVIVSPSADVESPTRDFPDVALASSPISNIEVVYVKMPWTNL